MDSSFNNVLQLIILTWSVGALLRQFIQFKFKNGHLDFFRNLVSCSLVIILGLNFFMEIDMLDISICFKWLPIPTVILGLGLVLECIFFVGKISDVQMKVLSRLPLLGTLICYAIAPSKSEIIFFLSVMVGLLLMVFSLGRARFERRLYYKMSAMFLIMTVIKSYSFSMTEYLTSLILFMLVNDFFKFQNAVGVKGLFIKEMKT